MREWRARNPEKIRAHWEKRREVEAVKSRERWATDPEWRQRKLDIRRKSWYSITPEQYQQMIERQEDRCAICRTDEPGGIGGWKIDHDHNCCPGTKSCGECIRGLLCTTCNTGIGMLRDDPVTMRAAADYVETTLRKI